MPFAAFVQDDEDPVPLVDGDMWEASSRVERSPTLLD